MKPLRNNRISTTVAAAALAGMSLASVFAAPNYIPPANTPLDSTTLSSSSPVLQNFNDFLGAIEAQLAAGTLATSGPAPSDSDFLAAVSAAVSASPGDAYGITQAAVAYNPKQMKNIVLTVATENPGQADEAVGAASAVVPSKAADAASSAILGLIAAGGAGGTYNGDLAGAADDAILEDTLSVAEKIAKAATKSVKGIQPGQAAQVRAEDIAAALVTSLLNDAGSSSNADLYLAAVASGAVSGSAKLVGTTQSDVATAIINALAAHPSVTGPNGYTYAVQLAMGALDPADFVSGDHAAVASALDAAVTAINASWAGAVNAGADVMGRIKQTGLGPITQADFQTLLTPAYANDIYAFVLGASVKAGSSSASFTEWALTDSDAVAGSGYQKSVVSAAVAGKPSGAGKVVGAAVTNGVAATDAISAAIPAADDLNAGKIVSAAYKSAPPADTAASQSYLAAAITAATGAGYQQALPEIAAIAAKSDKANASALAATAVAGVPNGWEEGVAASIVAGNPSAQAAADAAAVGKVGADAASVDLATDVAAAGKASKKTVFDDALTAYIANPDKARAVLFGAGAVNGKLATPLLGAALRLKGAGSDTNEALLNYAISLNKKSEAGIRLGYSVAVDVLSDGGDHTFDVVDHSTLIHSKNAVDIVQGAVSARPEYAHFVVRAAGRRAPKVAGKIGTAAIQFAHMKVVENDDTAAVAAISAGLITGLLDTGEATDKLIKAAVGGLIKGTLSFPTADKVGLTGAEIAEADGTVGGTVLTPSKGTAGVVTGAVAQTQGPGLAAADFSAFSTAVVTTAVKKAKLFSLAIAQAAAQAAYFVAQLEGTTFGDAADVAAILAAVTAGGPKGATAIQITNAINTGLAQAALGVVGAGAAGLTQTATAYDHHSGLNTPVTSLENF